MWGIHRISRTEPVPGVDVLIPEMDTRLVVGMGCGSRKGKVIILNFIKGCSLVLVILLAVISSALASEEEIISQQDTLGINSDLTETVVVSAPQVTLEEVIAAITKRAQQDDYLMASYEYTALISQVLRDDPGFSGDNYSLEEFAIRHHFSRESGDQVAQLWQRKRKFENGEPVEDEVDEEMSAEYVAMQDGLIEEMPFSSTGGHRYHYEILDRKLVGNNLIYKISFQPKIEFEALPSGTIWVDYSNWVVRKFEAHLTGAVPYPMFLESVPVYRMSQERFGDFWFPTEVFMQIKLRNLPLLPIPRSVEVRVSLQDIVVNGQTFGPEDRVPVVGQMEISEEEIASGFWISEEASNDSLTTFWNEMSRQWVDQLSPETIAVSLPSAKVDSLTGEGSSRLQDLRDGNLWRLKTELLKAPSYNRTQGLVARLGLKIEKQGPVNPVLSLVAGYGFANGQPVYDGNLQWPLMRSRWRLKDAPADGHQYLGATYEVLGLEFSGGRGNGVFAGDGRENTRRATAFFYGSDPNHYYEKRNMEGLLKWRLSRSLLLSAGGGFQQHRSRGLETRWNVLGRSLRPSENMAADVLEDKYAAVGGWFKKGPLQLDTRLIWHNLQDTPTGGTATDLREFKVSGSLDYLDGLGTQWLIRASHRTFNATTALQWKSWLGDYGTLRGYNAAELTGDASLNASVDARFGFDLMRMARVPLLKNWRLQPIGFLDWGKTWDTGIYPPAPGEGARGWRMDVGFGFGKRFDIPGLGEFNNVRLYAAHPVGDGSDGNGWRVLLAFEK